MKDRQARKDQQPSQEHQPKKCPGRKKKSFLRKTFLIKKSDWEWEIFPTKEETRNRKIFCE